MLEEEDEDDDDTEIEDIEKEIEDLAGEVMEELAFHHPIMFDTYNICEMATNNKLQNSPYRCFKISANFMHLMSLP